MGPKYSWFRGDFNGNKVLECRDCHEPILVLQFKYFKELSFEHLIDLVNRARAEHENKDDDQCTLGRLAS